MEELQQDYILGDVGAGIYGGVFGAIVPSTVYLGMLYFTQRPDVILNGVARVITEPTPLVAASIASALLFGVGTVIARRMMRGGQE